MIDLLLLAALALALLLLAALLLRPQARWETPPDLAARLGALEQQTLALTQAQARLEAASQRLEQQLQAAGERSAQQLQAASERSAQQQEQARHLLAERLDKFSDESRHSRKEFTESLSAFRAEVNATLKQQLEGNGQQIAQQFSGWQESLAQRLHHLTQGAQTQAELLRATLNERLGALQADNNVKLEEMRRTVDEKLHATLEQRLGHSFTQVSQQLEQVHAGLGEMRLLASSVGDLKRVMTNVRSRGTWGEVQLGALIESLLTAEQYAKNVKTVPGSNELVEYAVRMPGKHAEQPVWLPIDAKFPVEAYQRLLDAHESGDKALVQTAAAAFEATVRAEAKKIASKYLSPPHTTDFALLFLPTEGLFAEVCRIPGMVEALQNEHRVVVTGPTTLAAMLNSLRLGFRTLAIEQRSSEVWNLLAAVKTEFRKFGDIVDATHKSIDNAAKKFGEIGVRSRAIERKLRGVETLPEHTTDDLLGLDDGDSQEGAAPR